MEQRQRMNARSVIIAGDLTVISTFAGCGGSSLGYQWAGFKELLAIDFESHAIETFKLNFPDVDAWQADIRKVTAEAILERTGINKGKLDVLDGSPPCQGFSTAGKRKVIDNRNELPFEFIRLIEGLQPRAFVMENVSGMAKGGMRGLFNEILTRMKATGYHVEVHNLNAMYYGVPQSRERIIFIGMRDGQEIKWTVRQKIVTVREVIGHLPAGVEEEHQPQVIEAWHKSKPGQSLRKAVKYVGSFQSCRLDPDRPAPTLIKAHNHWHYKVPRYLTAVEAGLLQSFPEDFYWPGSKQEIKERTGNAVPPKMMQAIAECVKEVLEKE